MDIEEMIKITQEILDRMEDPYAIYKGQWSTYTVQDMLQIQSFLLDLKDDNINF